MFDFRIGRENFPNLWFKENFFCVFSAKSNIKPISIHLKDLYGHMTYGLSKIFVGDAILRTLTSNYKKQYISAFTKVSYTTNCLLNTAACLYKILPILVPTHITDLFTISNVNTKTTIRGHMMAYKCLCKCM